MDAKDTALMRNLLDTALALQTEPTISQIQSSDYNNSQRFGDVVITINQAELKDGADFDDVARKVGEAFVKELSRNGMTTANYAF